MPRKPTVLPHAQREARQRALAGAPLVGSIRGEGELAVELRFTDPEGKQTPSPRGITLCEGTRAYFHFACPMRDCSNGGFEANADVLRALTQRRNGHTGTATCDGVRPRGGAKNAPCNLQLHYTLAIRDARARLETGLPQARKALR